MAAEGDALSEDAVRDLVDALYRTESRRVLATLIRLLGDMDVAEEALHDAFAAALDRWPRDGVPANPRAWLVSTGRFRAIDHLRRRAHLDRHREAVSHALVSETVTDVAVDDTLPDDQLRLIFTCCHPALAPEAQIALTLRTVCGLTTEEIARAYLVPAPTLAQRIVRAKNKIRDARIPYEIPEQAHLAERLDAVLHVVYLVFNEGYSATAGTSVTRSDLAAEGIRLGRLLAELLPDGETLGLLALMLLHDSRREARMSADGDLLLLDEQDRSRWSRTQIEEGLALVDRVFATGRVGPYALQAAIAAIHARAPDATSTDWREIAGLYDVLLRANPSPVVELNRAVAVAMATAPGRGLALIDALLARGELVNYHLAHSARGELLWRLGRRGEARVAFTRALDLATQEPERKHLFKRLTDIRE